MRCSASDSEAVHRWSGTVAKAVCITVAFGCRELSSRVAGKPLVSDLVWSDLGTGIH